MNRDNYPEDTRQQSPTPSLLSRAVIADFALELSIEPPTGPARKLRIRPHTEQASWWLVEHTKTTDRWRIAGVEPLVNVDMTILTASHGESHE